jgi:hypothetical protein
MRFRDPRLPQRPGATSLRWLPALSANAALAFGLAIAYACGSTSSQSASPDGAAPTGDGVDGASADRTMPVLDARTVDTQNGPVSPTDSTAGGTPDASIDGRPLSDASPGDKGVADSGGTTAFGILTNRYDNLRSGANLSEGTLTASNVNPTSFGLLFSERVDGQIYAQPLYLSHLVLSDGSTHNVVFVATEHNTVFAFDADGASASAPLWQKNLGPSGPTAQGPVACDNLAPEVGITATPVIDVAAGTLFVLTKSYDGTNWAQALHALDVTTGNERLGSPQPIAASVNGTASDAVGGVVSFNPMLELGRPGLLLENGVVYAAFASHCDIKPYHGWVLGYRYDGAHFTQTHVFNVSPNGSQGGIWQAGVGLTSDGTSLFMAVGNGSTNPMSKPPDLSGSVVRLALTDLSLQDYWTPTAFASLNQSDNDLSTGVSLLPHNLLLTGNKAGLLYVLSSSNLGKYSGTSDQILQTLTTPGKAAGLQGHLHGGPIYYQRPADGQEWVYLWPEDSQLIGYRIDATTHLLQTNVSGGPGAQANFAAAAPGHPGGIVTLSANGNGPGSGIVWASTPKDPGNGAWHKLDTGVLYAVDAADITHLLWKADPLTLDDGSTANVAKFNSPVVANGRVFVGTFSNALNVYGLR